MDTNMGRCGHGGAKVEIVVALTVEQLLWWGRNSLVSAGGVILLCRSLFDSAMITLIVTHISRTYQSNTTFRHVNRTHLSNTSANT